MSEQTQLTVDGKILGKVRKFITASIPVLRKSSEYKGIHVVYSGFNTHFKAMFPGVDVRAATRALEEEQFIALVPTKGGVMLYLWADRPESYSGPRADQSEVQAAILAQMAALEASNDESDKVDESSES